MPKKTDNNPINDILASLSNETRRKILCLIGENEPITYSEILERTQLESGSFYWHTSKMAHLITQNQQKHYVLTQKGRIAFKLLTQDTLEEEEEKTSNLEVFLEKTGENLFHTKTWRLGFEVILLYALWGMLLSRSNSVQVFFITEVYTAPPWWLPWVSPIMNGVLLVIATNTSIWVLIASNVIKIQDEQKPVTPKTAQKEKLRKLTGYSLQLLFAFSAFIINGVLIHILGDKQGTVSNALIGITGLTGMLLFLIGFTAATMYSFHVKLKDVILLVLGTSYSLFLISYYFVGVLPF